MSYRPDYKRWRPTTPVIAALLLTVSVALFPRSGASQQTGVANWPSFRGPNGSGIAEGYATPTTWNVEENKNILWKTPLAGLGHSSPIVWGNKLFITTAISGKEKAELKVGLYGNIDPVQDDTVHTWKVYCLDKKSGKILWERVAYQGVPKVKRHTKGTHANSTMATDGKQVVAFFGSEGLYCYDLDGNLKWKKDFGLLDSGYFQVPAAQWGFASSPILYEGKVLVQCDVQNGSFVAALDAARGDLLWKTPREEVPTWSTPAICTEGGRTQVVVNGWKHIGGYDLATGKELWKMEGGGDIPVPTPVVAQGLIFITNAHGRLSPIYALYPDAQGTIANGENQSSRYMAWSSHRSGAYMQTPLVYGEYLYICRDNGVLGCYKAKTGEEVYQERLGTGRTGFTASAVASAGKLYFTSEMGDIYVVKAGPRFEILATNPMAEVCMATPALSEGVLYFRTQGHLVAIGEKK